jgi:glycosyltransferase involved in cell wall biosynthesis
MAEAIQQAETEWASSSELWQARREAARERIVDNFSLERMVEAYERVWKEVSAKSTAS